MLLAAHALGLGSLWFTMFDRDQLGKIIDLPQGKTALALVYLGKPAADPAPAPRKAFADKTVFIE
jgi:5,6-dimethylbenzimidazole synthase